MKVSLRHSKDILKTSITCNESIFETFKRVSLRHSKDILKTSITCNESIFETFKRHLENIYNMQ